MPINYAEFSANLIQSGYFSRKNKFRVEIFPPTGAVGGDADFARLNLNTKSIVLPGKNLEVGEYNYSGGYSSKKAKHTNFGELPMGIYLSEDLHEKNILDAWQSFIFDPEWQASRYPSEYYGTVEVTKIPMIREENRQLQTYTFHDAFPMNVQDLDQDYEAGDIDILNVSFAYNWWSVR